MAATSVSQGNGSRGSRRRLKIAVVVIAAALAIVMAAILALPIYLSSSSGKDFVLAKISDSVNGKVDAKGFSIGWFKGVKFTDINFADSTGSTRVKAGKLTAKPKYLSLLAGEFSPGPTEITDGNVRLIPAGGGRAVEFKNISAKVDINPPGRKTIFDIAFAVADGGKEAAVRAKGSVKPAKKWRLKGSSGDLTMKIDDLNLKSLGPLFALMEMKFDASGTLNADVIATLDDGQLKKLKANAVLSGLSKQIGDKQAVVDEPIRIDAEVSSRDDMVKIDKFSVVSSFCRIDGKGSADALDYTASADLKGLQDFAEQFADFGDYSITGKAAEKGRMSFRDGVITAKGSSEIKALVVSNGKKRTDAVDVKIDFDMATDKDRAILEIARFDTKVVRTGEVKITNSVVPLNKDAQSRLDIVISADAKLEGVLPFLNVAGVVGDDTELAGHLISRVTIKAKKEKLHIVTNNTKVSDLKIGKCGQEPFVEEALSLYIDMLCDTSEKTVEINDLRIDSSQIKIIKGKLTQTNRNGQTKMVGEFEAEYDLAALSAAASGFVPEGFTMEGKRRNKIRLESVYPTEQKDKMLANLNTEAKFGFDRAEYKGLNFGAAEIDLKVKKGLLTISPFTTSVNGGKLRFGGSVDFNEEMRLLKTPWPMQMIDKVNINDKMGHQILRYINPVFAEQANVTGVANFHCDEMSIPLSGGTNRDAVVVGTVAMNDVHLETSGLLGQIMSLMGSREKDMTVEPTDFVLRDGKLSYDNMQINIGQSPINFKGQIWLDDRIEMTMTLPYTLGFKKVKVGDEPVERVTLNIEGNLDHPRINMQKLLEDQAKKLLEEQLRKGLEKLFR